MWSNIIKTAGKPVNSLTLVEIHDELRQRDRLEQYFRCVPEPWDYETHKENEKNINRIKDLNNQRDWLITNG